MDLLVAHTQALPTGDRSGISAVLLDDVLGISDTKVPSQVRLLRLRSEAVRAPPAPAYSRRWRYTAHGRGGGGQGAAGSHPGGGGQKTGLIHGTPRSAPRGSALGASAAGSPKSQLPLGCEPPLLDVRGSPELVVGCDPVDA